MQCKRLQRGGLGLAALLMGGLLVAAPTAAVPVYGTSAQGELTGSRHVGTGGGLTGFNDWSSDFTVTWEIEQIPSSILWSYKYTFTGLDGSGQLKEISHLVLDLSDDCFGLDDEEEVVLTDASCVTDAELTEGEAVTMLMSGSTVLDNCGPLSNQACVDFGEGGSQDGITGSVKFDAGGGDSGNSVMYEFVSNRSPVYGHLAVKDGGGPGTCPSPGSTTAACSNGLLAGSDTMDTNDYVARPNGIIPEPGTVLLLGVGLGGLAVIGRRRR